MAKISKRYNALVPTVDRDKVYPISDALKIVKENATAKFNESIDVAINLGIDAKKSDQTVRGSVVMPAGTGKTVRVAVFAQGDRAKAAQDAGADLVGMDDLAADIKAGKMVILADSHDRENEGDLVLAASLASVDDLAFMAKKASGLTCLALEQKIVDKLHLPLMSSVDAKRDPSPHSAAFTLSIDARHGITTGISAADRLQTIAAVLNPEARPDDVVVPGHMFPLVAQADGVLVRAGHTEGSVDLMKIAGLPAAAIICEIMNDDGSMCRSQQLFAFAAHYGLLIVTIDDIIHYRTHDELKVPTEPENAYRAAYSTLHNATSDHPTIVDGQGVIS